MWMLHLKVAFVFIIIFIITLKLHYFIYKSKCCYLQLLLVDAYDRAPSSLSFHLVDEIGDIAHVILHQPVECLPPVLPNLHWVKP